MEIGIVGKPNVGKSTFFSAATLAPAEIANYPFTTIDANRGVAYVRTQCPHTVLNVQCNPRSSKCENGVRLVPVDRELAQAYCATGEGADKAGGYGIQGIGGILAESITGSYSAVVGLPLPETEQLLGGLGVDTWRRRRL